MTNLIDIKNQKQPTLLTKGQHVKLTGIDEYGSHNPIPFASIIKLARKGLSHEQIGKQFGVSKQAIWSRCKSEDFDIQEVDAYREHKETIFEHKQSLMVKNLTPERIKRMSEPATIIGIGILEDKILKRQELPRVTDESWDTAAKTLEDLRQLKDKLPPSQQIVDNSMVEPVDN